MRSLRNWVIAAGALSVSPFAVADKVVSNVVEMREACSVGRAVGSHMTALILYESGDVEYSVAANLKYRAPLSPKEVARVCRGLLLPLLEGTEELRPLLGNQDDTERYFVALPERFVEFPRLAFREIIGPDGLPDQVVEDPLSPRIKQLLREIDELAVTIFEERYDVWLLDPKKEKVDWPAPNSAFQRNRFGLDRWISVPAGWYHTLHATER